MRKRKFKVRGRTREEIIKLLEDDDRMQGRIIWETPKHNQNQVQCSVLRGVDGGLEEEEEGGDAKPTNRDEEEDQWEDVDPGNQGDNGMKVGEKTSPESCVGRSRDPGRQGGRGRRGFWVRRREDQLKKRLNMSAGEGTSPDQKQ